MNNHNTKNKTKDSGILTFVIICMVFIVIGAGYMMYAIGKRSSSQSNTSEDSAAQNSATIDSEGKQIINLTAKVGYSPKNQTAKAETASILKISTKNTFDCSSAFTIPALKISRNLPANGITEIQIPPQKAGTKLSGMCSMGMYSFSINFN